MTGAAKTIVLRDGSGPLEQRRQKSARREFTLSDCIRVVAHEPAFQFVAVGLLVWAGVEYWNANDGRYIIRLGHDEQQRLVAAYSQQFGEPPTAMQLQSLITRYIREEIYLREGRALKLDKDDEIVRRRIAQKYEFLQTDLAVVETPTKEALQRWFEQETRRYVTPERVAITHVYFSIDRDGEVGAKSRASKLLEVLRQTRMIRRPTLGDAFPGPSDVAALSPEDATRLFGESELSRTLFTLPLAQWVGPLRSGYGWHLVYLSNHTPPIVPPLDAVRDRVLADYMEERRRVLNEHNYERLRAKYTIQHDEPSG